MDCLNLKYSRWGGKEGLDALRLEAEHRLVGMPFSKLVMMPVGATVKSWV